MITISARWDNGFEASFSLILFLLLVSLFFTYLKNRETETPIDLLSKRPQHLGLSQAEVRSLKLSPGLDRWAARNRLLEPSPAASECILAGTCK